MLNALNNVDYRFTEALSYTTFVPVVSLLVQRIQLSALSQYGKLGEARNKSGVNMKFARSIGWHMRGSLAQFLICQVAASIFASPIFTALSVLALGQFCYTQYLAFKHHNVAFPNTNGFTMRTPTILD